MLEQTLDEKFPKFFIFFQAIFTSSFYIRLPSLYDLLKFRVWFGAEHFAQIFIVSS